MLAETKITLENTNEEITNLKLSLENEFSYKFSILQSYFHNRYIQLERYLKDLRDYNNFSIENTDFHNILVSQLSNEREKLIEKNLLFQSELKTELEKVKSEKFHIQEEYNTLKNKYLKQLSILETELKSEKSTNVTLTTEGNFMKKKLIEYELENQYKKPFKEEKSILKENLLENDNMINILETQRNKSEKLCEIISDLQEKLQNSLNETEILKKNNKKYKKKLQKLNEENQEAEQQIIFEAKEANDKALVRYKEKLKKYKHKIEQLKQRLVNNENNKENFSGNDVNMLLYERDELEKNYKDCYKKLLNLQKKNEELEEEIETNINIMKQMEEEIDNNKNKLEEQINKSNEFSISGEKQRKIEESLQKSEKSRKQMELEKNSMSNEIIFYQNELQLLREKQNDLEKDLLNEKDLNAKLKKENENIQLKNKSFKNDNFDEKEKIIEKLHLQIEKFTLENQDTKDIREKINKVSLENKNLNIIANDKEEKIKGLQNNIKKIFDENREQKNLVHFLKSKLQEFAAITNYLTNFIKSQLEHLVQEIKILKHFNCNAIEEISEKINKKFIFEKAN